MYQCCQMVYFQTKNFNLGNTWKVYLPMEAFGIFMAILSILRPICILYGNLVHFVVIWYIFSRFGMLYRVKYGNTVMYQSVVTLLDCHPKLVSWTLATYLYLKVLQYLDLYPSLALMAWHSGLRVRLQNRRSRVRIPPGYNVLGKTFQCCCQNFI
jgi:hypothetical protein